MSLPDPRERPPASIELHAPSSSSPRQRSITPELWARIEDLFARALDLPEPERARLLGESAGADPLVRAEVEALLAEHGGDPGFLDTPAAWLPDVDHESDAVPERIGPYRILRTLGRGGMGQVYLAEREAPGFRQVVALKVVRRGLDTDDLLARFRNERQILARLEHPNIARLLDVGATAQGLPYFVMEHVDGVPFREFCDRGRMGVTERLRIFQTVCAAVHYAHRNLIVHRDIKPQNILVTADGVPKLLDFGIAKILEPGEAEAAGNLTRADARLLTPEYCAPEQIRGDPITTACDVYALGVLVYVLLAGRHPYAPAPTRAELERLALEVDPPPPGRAAAAADDAEAIAATRGTTVPQLRRRLEGDIDTIVLKALRKEPEARYASALSLSEDIERHLTGLPVQARAATAGYRVRKFVSRNRIAVGAAAGLFLVLAASTSITLYQSGRIREESARVARERDKALEVRSFLLEMFGATGPDEATGDTVTARQLLDRRAATLADAYGTDLELQSEMMSVLAEGYEKLGLVAQAEPLARRALEARTVLFGRSHPDVAVSLNVLGWLMRERGQLEEAEALLREAVEIGRTAFPAGDAVLARALNDFGVVRDDRGGYAEAEALLRESLAMRRLLLGENHVGVPITTSNLAVALFHRGDLDGAVRAGEEALELFRRIIGPDHQRTMTVQTNLAAFQSYRGDHAGSAAQHRDILERRRRLFGPRHASVPISLTMLANELMVLREWEESERLLVEALALQRAQGARPDQIGGTLRVLGTLKARAGRDIDAVADYTAALPLLRSVAGDSDELVYVLGLRASSRTRLGELDGAERDYREAAAIAEGALGPLHQRTLQSRMGLVLLLVRQRRLDEARAELAELEPLLDEAGIPAGDRLRRNLAAARTAMET